MPDQKKKQQASGRRGGGQASGQGKGAQKDRKK